jgi:rhodanese-related sulfurtransferase
MGLFDFLKSPDINQGVEDYKTTNGAVLLDVRTPQEYKAGHIPGSKNISLQTLDNVKSVAAGKDTPLFVYCQSGNRSKQASMILEKMGYTNVKNIGGIAAYKGKVEK